jgi:hypothetical protein
VLHRYQIARSRRLLGDPVAFDDPAYRAVLAGASDHLLGGTFRHADQVGFTARQRFARRMGMVTVIALWLFLLLILLLELLSR